eukprot:s655_g5.t1
MVTLRTGSYAARCSIWEKGRRTAVASALSGEVEVLGFGLTTIDFLKVDCEGCEWDVFAPRIWERVRRRIRHVATELHLWALPDKAAEGLESDVRALGARKEGHGRSAMSFGKAPRKAPLGMFANKHQPRDTVATLMNHREAWARPSRSSRSPEEVPGSFAAAGTPERRPEPGAPPARAVREELKRRLAEMKVLLEAAERAEQQNQPRGPKARRPHSAPRPLRREERPHRPAARACRGVVPNSRNAALHCPCCQAWVLGREMDQFIVEDFHDNRKLYHFLKNNDR